MTAGRKSRKQAPPPVKAVVLANPAPGTNFTHTVPTNQVYELMSVLMVLRTSNIGLLRRVRLGILDPDGNSLGIILQPRTQPVRVTGTYTFWVGAKVIADGRTPAIQAPLPAGMILGPGSVIRSEIFLMHFLDQIMYIAIGRRIWLIC